MKIIFDVRDPRYDPGEDDAEPVDHTDAELAYEEERMERKIERDNEKW
jgi:hypothetical protein